MSAAARQAHGHTPAAWTGVTISFIGFMVSGVAMILPNVLLVCAGLVVVLLGGVVGKAMQMAGMGRQPSKHTAAVAADKPATVSVS